MTIIGDTEIRPFRTDIREPGSKHWIVAEVRCSCLSQGDIVSGRTLGRFELVAKGSS